MKIRPKLSSLGLEFLLTLYDDLRSDRFESKSPLEKFILSLMIIRVKFLINIQIKKGEPHPF